MTNFLKGLGYFLIWGDFYLVFFAVHAVVVGPINLEEHLQVYLNVFFPIVEWVKNLKGLFEAYIEFVYPLPAVVLYGLRFTVSTSIGIWLVRKYS